MMIIRKVRKEDIEGVAHCASQAGVGISNLPKKRNVLEKSLEFSYQSFEKKLTSPKDEEYLFVLADHATQIIGGTCGIYSKIGVKTPFYTFHIDQLPSPPLPLPIPSERRLFTLKEYKNGPSEVCALFLLPEFRKEGLGKLLSFSRFLFMACFPERFDPYLIANMRGYIENRISPFWNGIGRHFLDLSYDEVSTMRSESEEFLTHILPKYPLYVSLLPKQVQDVIAKTHPQTTPAMEMLMKEGLHFIDEIDPLDGGPILGTYTKEVRIIKNSVQEFVQEITQNAITSERYLICNQRIDFRACFATVKKSAKGGVILQKEIADALEVEQGDAIRYIAV